MANVLILSRPKRENLLTSKDKEAIEKAKRSCWEDIEEDWAETDNGKKELHSIIMRKYHYDELRAGML